MLINPDIEAWFEKLQGRRLGAGGSAPRGQGLPNYGSSALEGIVKPGSGMYGFTAPQIRSNYRPTPIAPSPGLPSPGQQVVPFQGLSGGGRDLGGGAKAAGLQKLGSGIEQAMKTLAEKRQAAQQAADLVKPYLGGPLSDQMRRNPGATMPPGAATAPPASPAAPAPYSPAPIGAASETPTIQGMGEGAQPIPPIGAGGALPYFAAAGGTSTAGGPSPGYLAKLAAIENPSGNPYETSPTGATGKYQFTQATWKDFGGGGDIHNNADQDAAIARLNKYNYNGLSKALGRPPTDGEMYLAHQQGLTGATVLLQNPNAPAGSVTSARNISVNNGDPNAPASQFVQKWTRRFGGAAGPPPLTTPSAQAFAASPPSMIGAPSPAFAGPGVAPAAGSQSVIPGQTDPHAPGFDPNSVPFHRTPEMGTAPSIANPAASPDEIQMNLKPPRGFDAAPQGGPVTVPIPPPGGAEPGPTQITPGQPQTGPAYSDQTWNNRPQFDYSAPATGAANVPVPPPRPADSGQPPILNGGQPGVYSMPDTGPQSMNGGMNPLAAALANGAPDVTPQLDQSAMLSMALAQPDFVAPPVDFGGGFNSGGMFG